MTKIYLFCKGATARAKVEGQITAKTVGLPVEILWDNDWEPLRRILKVRCGDVERSVELGSRKTGIIPWECLIAGQMLEIGMDGWDDDGSLRIPTNWAKCETVRQSVADADGEAAENPTPPGTSGMPGEDGGYYIPSVDTSGNLSWTASKTGMASVQSANIKGPKGDPGAAGYTPVKGTDYWTAAERQAMINDVLQQVPSGGGGGSGTAVQAGFATPEMYGAVGDGVTDDTAAIQQAVDENYRVRLGGNKTYRITKAIVLRSGVEFYGGVNTVLKNTRDGGIWKQCIIAGFVGAMEQTTAPSKLPSIAVTVSGNTATGTGLGTSCAVGDIIMIHGSEYVDVSAGSGRYKNYRDFQIERVMAVSGNTITLEHPIDVPMTSYAVTALKDFAIINEDDTLHGFVVSDVYVHDLTFQCALSSSSAWYTLFFCGYNSRFENLRYDNCPACFGCNLAAYSIFRNISGTTYDSFADMPEYQFRNIYSDWDVVRGEHIVNNLMFAVTHGHGNLFRNLRLKTTELTDGPMLSVTHSREITVVGCEFIGNGTGIIIPYHENGRTSVIDGNVFDVEYQAIDVRDKSRNSKITNNIVRSGNLFYLSAAVSDGNGARDRGIYAANNVMAGREPIEESINTQIRTSGPISLFSGSRYPVVGDCIETEFVTDSAYSLVFSVQLGSKTQTLNSITHPAGYFRAGIYFIANSLYRFVYTDNSGGYFSQIYKGLNAEENSIRDIAITVKDSSGAAISGCQIGKRYTQNQYGYAILGQGEDTTVVEPEPPAEVTDTVIFPPTSSWEFTKMMEQADSTYTIGTCEYTGDTFTGSFSGASKGVGIRSANKISLSGFSTLHIEFSASELQSGSQFNVYIQNTLSTAGDVIDHVATSGELTAGVIDIDISGISGSYYILIGAIAWYNRNVSITISKVTLKGGTTA